MQGAAHRAEYRVQQVAERLHERLRSYLEAQYHIRDAGLIAERHLLLRETGTIGQQPYLETTPSYQLANGYAGLGLPQPVYDLLTELATQLPEIGVFPRPYVHQARALQAFFDEGRDLVVASGTGSGKTETFLWTILGQLWLEATARPESFRRPGFRALLLYPMNALVSDQLARLRRLFGDPRLAARFAPHGRVPRFGMYTSRTPYPGPRSPHRDQERVAPVLEYYVNLLTRAAQDEQTAQLVRDLQARGRWPAKDLQQFYGAPKTPWPERLHTQPGDRELLTRHEMQQWCPDILVTNYSMLEYMLLRPIERSIFQQTRDWLASDQRNQLLLVLDEAHLYRGAAGAEVALLIRRLQARLGITRDRLRCIITSASLGSTPQAEQAVQRFAVGLTGRPRHTPMPFTVLRGEREQRPLPRPGTPAEAAALARVDLLALFRRVEEPVAAFRTIAGLAQDLAWPPPPGAAATATPVPDTVEDRLRAYLYQQLSGFGPLELLIARTAGNATAYATLAQTLFPEVPPEEADLATAALLALGTYARSLEGRPLLPARVHLFFRGLPTLYACVNPCCDVRRYRPGEPLLLGRLYTEPRTHCTCKLQARVYELYTHRDCGAAFLRVFGRGARAEFYWHEQGGTVENMGATNPLDEALLLVEAPHPEAVRRGHVEPVWLDMTTGRVQTAAPADPTGYRLLYRPAARRDGERLWFQVCPACTKRSGEKILDLATEGEQPFATLVRAQFMLQPATKSPSAQYPNGGRKVLLFSDGRQKAARLARDLPREVEFDTFRQALALAVQRLHHLQHEARLDHVLYTAFVAVCHDFHLHFFDRQARSQEQLLQHTREYHQYYDACLQDALEEAWNPPPPPGYRRALLRQLADPYYSLYAAAAAIVRPANDAMQQLRRRLRDLALPSEFMTTALRPAATAWIAMLLDRMAFDREIPTGTRYDLSPFFQPIGYEEPVQSLERLLRDTGGLTDGQVARLRQEFYAVLTERDEHGEHAYLRPERLALELALEHTWYQCRACGLVQCEPVLGRCAWCLADRLEERPPDHPYMTSRKGYFRDLLRAVLAGERPVHLSVEEHTAQLSHRDAGDVYATTEEYELRFQDVWLGPDKPPVDVLSCTTTMEVGVDIGSLIAVGLRTVPPQRENYQQRSGRAGRRGASVSTVVTYAQGGPHDSHYYAHPDEIISGEPREPRVKVDNPRLARRHVHALLIQTFFHTQLDQLPQQEQQKLAATRSTLFSALGTAAEFFCGQGPFSLPSFRQWIEAHVLRAGAPLAAAIADWLPDELAAGNGEPHQLTARKRAFVVGVAQQLVQTLEQRAAAYAQTRVRGQAARERAPADGEADVGTFVNADVQAETPVKRAPADGEADAGTTADDERQGTTLLDALFDEGLLPRYAFPTDLCTFYTFERDPRGRGVKIKERVQQGKAIALSEYAPGRLLVVDKQTYRVGGIYLEGTRSAAPARALFSPAQRMLSTYVYCPACTYVRLGALEHTQQPCPICATPLRQWEFLDPPGFSPEKGLPLSERDREQEPSYATGAQFPVPVPPERYQWHAGAGVHLRYAYGENQRLFIVNKGPNEEGFSICEECGAAWPASQRQASQKHDRPFLLDRSVPQQTHVSPQCSGPLHQPVHLGHVFATDLLLVRFELHAPLDANPGHPWLHDALRTTAEALTLAASRHLDIDPGELSAGYRLMRDEQVDPSVRGLAEIYLFDTASGGAGYAAEAGEEFPAVLEQALHLLRTCPASCERSCPRCLRYYGNRYWHERLDRFLAADLLTYARDGQVPRPASLAAQAQHLAPLARYLALEGWTCERAASVRGVPVPLLVRAPQEGGIPAPRLLAVGTFPALLDEMAEGFSHPLDALRREAGTMVVLLPDYLVLRDLPRACHLLRERVPWLQ